MAMELNRIVGNYIDQDTGRPCSPSISGENAFLNCIVTPIYQVIKVEFGNSSNYDEINKYFWSRRCLGKLKWPIDVGNNFFRKGKRVWNIGFVMPNLHTKLYSFYSSIVSMGVGLFNNVDEIQNMQQLRLNFRFLASAMQHSLMSNARGTFKGKFKKVESNKVKTEKFTLVWNEIIWALREEDRVSDHEVELLELPENTWNVRVVCWPCFLLSNELLLALNQAQELVDHPEEQLWVEMAKNEYRRCVVIEAYDSVKHLLLTIVKFNTPEHSILTNLFQEIDDSLDNKKFTKTYNMLALPTIHKKLITLVDLLIKPKKDVHKVANSLRAIYEVLTHHFFKDKMNMQDQLPFKNNNAIELPDSYDDESFYRHVKRLHTILTTQDAMNINVPKNLEARRWILCFSNSLFSNMPRAHAPQVKKMMALSVLTPYNKEEIVIYTKEQLRAEKEDGVSLLHHLQTLYSDEWENIMERMRHDGMSSEDELWTRNLRDLRLWASYRGQTLARTVRGTMYYYRALKLLAFLDSASEIEIREGIREQMCLSHGGLGALIRAGRKSNVNSLLQRHDWIQMKYTYVVACEMYGSQKAKKDPIAEEILYLMKNNETLRVAYVDEVKVRGASATEYYSVLVKYDQEFEKEVEIYRVKLPGPLKLVRDGKPENLNHAMIFSRGDFVEIMEMNEEKYFEEAVKVRNLLEEYDICKPTMIFDRFWFLTRGGIHQ